MKGMLSLHEVTEKEFFFKRRLNIEQATQMIYCINGLLLCILGSYVRNNVCAAQSRRDKVPRVFEATLFL